MQCLQGWADKHPVRANSVFVLDEWKKERLSRPGYPAGEGNSSDMIAELPPKFHFAFHLEGGCASGLVQGALPERNQHHMMMGWKHRQGCEP